MFLRRGGVIQYPVRDEFIYANHGGEYIFGNGCRRVDLSGREDNLAESYLSKTEFIIWLT